MTLDLIPLLDRRRLEERRARRRRRRLWAVLGLAVLVVLVNAAAAQGQPRAAAEESDVCANLRADAEGQPDPSRLAVRGVRGMWFPMAIARLQMCEVRELRLRRREVRVGDAELGAWRLQLEFTERQVELAVEARNRLEGVVDDADRRAREAEAALGVWYRSPVLWAVVGAVVAGVLFAGAVAALDALRPE